MRKSFSFRGAGFLMAALILAPNSLGHNCSPSPITVEVGKTITYRIVADVQESEPSFYNLSINEHPDIATVSPDNFTALNYGEFRIRGVSPGTNQVVLEWAYEPFDASGFCVVEVIVVEPTPVTSGTAANYPQSATANDPVNVLTGELVLLEEPDFDLGGPMPLVFQRYYASRLLRDGLVQSSLGRNWAHNFDMRLIRDGDWIEVVFYQGASIPFEREGEAWRPARASSGTFQLVETDGGYLLGDPKDGKRYRFNSQGQLLEIADGKGSKHSLVYEGLLLKEVADDLGRTITFSYGGFQELRSITDGSRTVFLNQSGRNLVKVTNVAGDSTEYSYENSQAEGSLLTARKLPRGNTPFTQVYNSEGRVISQLDADGNEWKFDYIFTTNIVTIVTDPTTKTTTFRHNMNGQLVELTDGNGNTVVFGYDDEGRRSSIVDREGALTLYDFHPEAGRVASIRHANGATTQITYTPRVSEGLTFFDLTRLVHPDGTDETFKYDSSGNRIEHVDQSGNTNLFSFTSTGQMAGSTNALGGSITNTYNEDGTLASVTDGSGNETSYTYNVFRQVIEEKHPDGTRRQFLRNHRNQITVLTNELGGVVTYSHDKNGNRTEELQPTGNRETFTYDAMDRMVGLTLNGEPIALSFDSVGRLDSLTDRRGNSTTWNYDPAGHIISVDEPGPRTWGQTVDAEGVPTSRTDPLGKQQEFTSDVMGKIGEMKTAEGRLYGFSRNIMGRVTGLRQPDGTTAERFYDERGNVTRDVLPGGTVSAAFEFNGMGQTERVIDPNGEPWDTTFDEQGSVLSRRDPLGNEVAQEFDSRGRPNKVTFPEEMGHLDVTYDGLNAITRRNYSDGTDLDYRYNAQGHFIGGTGLSITRNTEGEIIECNGLGLGWEGGLVKRITVAPEKVITYIYNNRNLVESISDWAGVAVTFSYDNAGQLIGISRTNGVNASFTYDDDGYVRSVTEGTTSLLLERDSNGRVTGAERITPAAAVLSSDSHGFTYDAASQLETGTYDRLGGLLQEGGRNYTWDLASRLTQYTENGSTISFTYDCMGNRLTRSENGSTRGYLWNYALDIPSMMVLKDGEAPILFFVYTPDGRLSYSINASTGERRFYHFDEIGNTLFLSDEDGEVVARYAHGPYGEDLGGSGVEDNPFTWQGRFGVMQERDTGLFYMRARFYDSRSARFLSRDPLRSTVPEAINPYQYARGNPLRFIDPLGLDPQGTADQTPAIPNGSARNAVTVKPDSALTDPEIEEGEPPRWQHGETVHLTDREWNIEVAITKKKLRDRVKKYGWFDPQTAMGFDSVFLRYQRVTFYFRGHYMSGGNLNYYFQGMLWAEMGVPKEVLIAAIYHWKWYKYNADPNPLDIFAACEGFKDNANFVTELRSEFQNEVNKLPTVPRVIVQDVMRGGLIGHMLDWFYFD